MSGYVSTVARRRDSQASRIAQTLLERIRSGTYPVGSRLPSERLLADEFNVSRPVVREALSTVSALDVLDTQMGRGAFVISMPADNSALPSSSLQDVVNVREVLETGALRLAARRPTPARIASVQNALTELRSAVDSKGETAELDTVLHKAIIEASGSPLLVKLWESLEQQIEDTIRISPHGRTMSPEIFVQHEILAAGVTTGDIEDAVEASVQLHEENRRFLHALLG
jgi:GntR family transcriptional regulator, transcriptional repressor for pyruvate dehydrogenase complex